MKQLFAMLTAGTFFYALVWSLSAPTASVQAAAGNAANGKKLYAAQCTVCHGVLGKGDGPAGKSLKPPARDLSSGVFKYGSSDAALAKLIKTGKSPMPGFANLSDQQLKDLVAYIRTLKKK
ncbi:MAG: hypothetical protein CVV27_06750 [Candidatus Melainabacteria bacterium HGW-Melainabacteria-1]|nr:MAG: hypothetical protein CVV27_06750 [Candidatus Melainabacteria bacterium HGW-Melainabacteria-1]